MAVDTEESDLPMTQVNTKDETYVPWIAEKKWHVSLIGCYV